MFLVEYYEIHLTKNNIKIGLSPTVSRSNDAEYYTRIRVYCSNLNVFFIFWVENQNRLHFSGISNAFIYLDDAHIGHADFRQLHTPSVWSSKYYDFTIWSSVGRLVGRLCVCVSAKRMRGRERKGHVKNKLLHQNEKGLHNWCWTLSNRIHTFIFHFLFAVLNFHVLYIKISHLTSTCYGDSIDFNKNEIYSILICVIACDHSIIAFHVHICVQMIKCTKIKQSRKKDSIE